MTLLLIVVGVTIWISANCSLYEAVLYSTRTGTLESAKTREKHPKLAGLFAKMKRNISGPIAAILILNTVANTAGATLAGMYSAEVLGTHMVPVFSAVFTLAILFFSEIIPKTLGAVHWRIIWPYIVYPMKFMNTALAPVIWFTEKLAGLLTGKGKMATVTEDEILALVHLGAREGQISKDESRMVRNIISLEDRQVQEIMTPRTMMQSISARLTLAEAIKAISGRGFSRFPIYEGDRENITGYVVLQDLLSPKNQENTSRTLKEIARPISFVDEEANCLTLLTTFLRHRRHIAVVSDEYGGVDGIVTLEDLLETILGSEIVDETDNIVDLQEAARKRRGTGESS